MSKKDEGYEDLEISATGTATLDEEEVVAGGDEDVEAAIEETKPKKGGKKKGPELPASLLAKLPKIMTPTKIDPRLIEADPKENFSRGFAGVGRIPLSFAYDVFSTGTNTTPAQLYKRDGKLRLNSGFRRREAGLMIIDGFDYVHPMTGEKINVCNPDFQLSVILLPDGLTDDELRIMNWRENDKRQEISSMDRAYMIRYFEEVAEPKWTSTQIARHMGVDTSYISQLRKLLDLPKADQNKVHSRGIPARAAMAIAAASPEARAKIWATSDASVASGGTGKVRLRDAALVLREEAAQPGAAPVKRISMTSTEIRKFLEDLNVPGEDPAVRKFSAKFIDFIGGKAVSLKQMRNAIYSLLNSEATPAETLKAQKAEAKAEPASPPVAPGDSPEDVAELENQIRLFQRDKRRYG